MRLIDLMIQTAYDNRYSPPVNDNSRDIIIAGLSMDSRTVRPGYLFAALPGATTDGSQYIEEAIQNGAVAVLAAPGVQLPASAGGIVLIEDPNPRKRFARMAAKFFGKQPETIVTVTGTNGKTSAVSFCRQIWASLGKSSASMGSLGVEAPQFPDWTRVAGYSLNTPDPVTLQHEMADLAEAGVSHLAMEASSHGLDQYRMDGIKLKVAGFTNLTRDHLDYHGSMGAYFNAKSRLFTEVMAPGSVAVINADSEYAERLEDICLTYGHRVILYGWKGRDITLISQTPSPFGQTLQINVFGTKYTVEMPVAGTFQAVNALCALGMTLATETEPKNFKKYVAALNHLSGVRGRIELVGQHPKGGNIYVDYAHTPDGLETILKALRPHTAGKLHVVFGCGGNRDAGKRPMMGEIAARLADRVIVTDDNPRSENPKRIRQEILSACPGAVEVADRREAIATALKGLKAGDILVVAGKGHEQGQIIDQVTHPFDDATEVRAALKRIK